MLMSGYSDDVILRTGIEAAETPFIQKPFTATDLALKVREVLSGPASSRNVKVGCPFTQSVVRLQSAMPASPCCGASG
jgi:hypothetical protein